MSIQEQQSILKQIQELLAIYNESVGAEGYKKQLV
jgi:hypothetical protein